MYTLPIDTIHIIDYHSIPTLLIGRPYLLTRTIYIVGGHSMYTLPIDTIYIVDDHVIPY